MIAFVSMTLRCSYEEAHAIVRQQRSWICPNVGFENELRVWCRDQQQRASATAAVTAGTAITTAPVQQQQQQQQDAMVVSTPPPFPENKVE